MQSLMTIGSTGDSWVLFIKKKLCVYCWMYAVLFSRNYLNCVRTDRCAKDWIWYCSDFEYYVVIIIMREKIKIIIWLFDSHNSKMWYLRYVLSKNGFSSLKRAWLYISWLLTNLFFFFEICWFVPICVSQLSVL